MDVKAVAMNVADIINACDRKCQSVGLVGLTPKERLVVLASRANFAVELGGVGAFFHNSTGACAREVVDALIEIGAMDEAAAINRGRELRLLDCTHKNWQPLLNKPLRATHEVNNDGEKYRNRRCLHFGEPVMRHPVLLTLACLAMTAFDASAQQMDMEAMQRWGSAERVYYAVEGVHSGTASMTATMGGVADVVDRVSMRFEWSLSEVKLLKVTTLKNYTSEVKNLRDRESKCLPPVLKGAYELATVLEVVNGLGGAIDLKVERSYPAVDVAQSCTASRKAIGAEKKVSVESMAVPSPMIMAMGAPATDQLSYSADKRSMIVNDGNWTWTFTPSVTPLAK